MFCNESATLYHKNASNQWVKTYFPEVYWYEKLATVAEKSGLITKQATVVYIPFAGSVPPDIKTGVDFILKGNGDDIDNESEQTQSASIKALGNITTVKAYCPCLFGSKNMHHLELVVY